MPDRVPGHEPEGHPDSELISSLEPDQLTAVSNQPLPRAQMSRLLNFALLLLRAFSLLITAIVVYVFIAQMHYGQ